MRCSHEAKCGTRDRNEAFVLRAFDFYDSSVFKPTISRRSHMNTVVLITGALAGIGRATAVTYAREKACVVVSGRSQEKGDELVRELRALGAEAEYFGADVRVEG